jgi:hypothetical protein
MNIIQCYLGGKLPKYAILNAKSIMSIFPDIPYVLVVDSWWSVFQLKRNRIPYFLADSKVYAKLNDLLQVDKQFRNGFWVTTTARFLAINSAANLYSGPIIHVESDVILGSDFPFNSFRDFEYDIAFPMESQTKGCASVLYFRNAKKVNEFCDELLIHVRTYPKTTDMHFLGSLVKSSKLSVSILPSKWEDELFNFGGFFDSTSWGQYFAGVDPRNYNGSINYGLTYPEHSSKVSGYQFTLKEGRFVVSKGLSIFPLFAMHVHSKNKSLIRFKSRSEEFERINTLHKNSINHEFNLGIYLMITFGRITNKVKRFFNVCFKSLGNRQ